MDGNALGLLNTAHELITGHLVRFTLTFVVEHLVAAFHRQVLRCISKESPVCAYGLTLTFSGNMLAMYSTGLPHNL